MRLGKILSAVVMGGMLLASHAMAVDVSVLTEILPEMTRISIGSEYPLNPKIEKTDTHITINFPETISGNFKSISDKAASVVSAALSDNKTLTLNLARPLVVRDYVSGGVVRLELLAANDPKSFKRPAPKEDGLATISVLPTSQIKLFAIQRKDSDQLVISFPNKVGFRQSEANGNIALTFDVGVANPAALKISQALTAFPKELQKISFGKAENGALRLSMQLPNGFFATAIQSGRQVTVSITKGQKKAPVVPEMKKEAAKAKSATQDSDNKVKSIDKAEKITPVVSDKELAKSVSYSVDDQNISLSLKDPLSLKGDFDEEVPVLQADSGYRSASLSFPWNRMTAAAAFRRQGYVWLVFDRKDDFNFDMELDIYKDIIYEIVQVPHSKATIFRLSVAPGYNPSVRREGLLWVVDLMYQPLRPKKNANLILQRKTPFGPRIFVPMDEVPEIIPIIDPEVGDFFYIVPMFSLGKGLSHKRSFVDATFLPTAQGLAIVPNIEDLTVYSSSSGLEIRGPQGGMRFSSEDILSILAKRRINSDPMAQILDAGVWAINTEPAEYQKMLKQLMADVINASNEEKPVKRLLLARYYFANGMYPETLGLLRTIQAETPAFAAKKQVIALRGAANFMMMRYKEALADLSNPELEKDDAVAYWRAAASAAISRSPDKFIGPMRDNMAILQSYPQLLKSKLALAGLHSAVVAGDEFSVQNFMEAAFSSENSPAIRAEIKFYHALWQEMNGMYSAAEREMKKISEGTDFYFRAMAGLEKIRMAHRMGDMTPEQRIEELERLSYAWRGDDFEYNLMTMLVAAYQDQKDYAQVMYTLKSMEVRFADQPESKKIPQLMSKLFEQIYLTGENISLPPIKAIALFDEFQDLMPKGEKGAQIVRRLADQLVSIDLLDRAASLLDQQLKQPIGSYERGLVATRLALVRLLNREPQETLKALEISEGGKFSEKVMRQRRHMKAKALADIGKPEDAAKLLDDDESEEAKLLKAEIYWQAQIWDKAADALKMLIKRPEPNVPLTHEEAQRVLNWAAALRLAGRPKVVIRLRENFLPYMKQTDLAEAFDFITSSPQQGVMDYRRVAEEVKAAENFNSFAKGYTDLVRKKGLSEAVQ